jgi:hypothetical protein
MPEFTFFRHAEIFAFYRRTVDCPIFENAESATAAAKWLFWSFSFFLVLQK